jgi:hypothetical protein
MSTFLTTLPTNLGFYNLGTVEAYPTGGTGPTAYGPTSYFGSDPLPPQATDSVNTAQDLGNFAPLFKSIFLKATHGGNTRVQSTFYKLTLLRPRSIIITQNYSTTSYEQNTNRNTVISIYKIEDGTHRRELPINSDGYVYFETGLSYSDSGDDDRSYSYGTDYPKTSLPEGNYIVLITNDIRYLETNYSLTLNIAILDWRYDNESAQDFGDFGTVIATIPQQYRTWNKTWDNGQVTDSGWNLDHWDDVLPLDPVDVELDFGLINEVVVSTGGSNVLGYTREGVSP